PYPRRRAGQTGGAAGTAGYAGRDTKHRAARGGYHIPYAHPDRPGGRVVSDGTPGPREGAAGDGADRLSAGRELLSGTAGRAADLSERADRLLPRSGRLSD